jgi:hypothetical protein
VGASSSQSRKPSDRPNARFGVSTSVGRAGDHIAAAALHRLGVPSAISNQDGFDIAIFLNEKSYRLEVKAANGVYSINNNKFTFSTNTGNKTKTKLKKADCDIVCLVALPTRTCIFKHISQITAKNTRLWCSIFTIENETRSWNETMEMLE